jgi:hypothetical protein
MTIKAEHVKGDIITHAHNVVANGEINILPRDFEHRRIGINSYWNLRSGILNWPQIANVHNKL